MLVVLNPRLDGSIDTASTVHLAGQLLKRHCVGWVNRRTIGLDHLRGSVPASSDEHSTWFSVTVIRLKGFLADLLSTQTKAAGLAIVLNHAHNGLSVFFPLLKGHRTVAGHELGKTSVVLRHDELSVVTDALGTSLLVHLLLWLGEVRKTESNIG